MFCLENAMTPTAYALPLSRRRWLAASGVFATLACTTLSRALRAQPETPLRLIVQAAPGNTLDVVTRAVAEPLGQRLGRAVVVLNRPGAGGLIATREAVAAAADGHTLYMAGASALTVLPLAQPDAGFDALRDLTLIGLVAELPLVVAAGPTLGVGDIAQLVSLARQSPGRISFAANTAGTVPHLAGVRMARAAGVEFTFVPYPGGAPQAVADVASGRVSFLIEGLAGLAPAIRSGLVKPLAVLSARRLIDQPDWPTVAETLPGLVVDGWMALTAPKGVASEKIEAISEALRTVLQDSGLQTRLQSAGAYAVYRGAGDLARLIREEQRAWAPWVRPAQAAASAASAR
jgi:tripartite-type tricarboxylate transporter receptor subunit TctC